MPGVVTRREHTPLPERDQDRLLPQVSASADHHEAVTAGRQLISVRVT